MTYAHAGHRSLTWIYYYRNIIPHYIISVPDHYILLLLYTSNNFTPIFLPLHWKKWRQTDKQNVSLPLSNSTIHIHINNIYIYINTETSPLPPSVPRYHLPRHPLRLNTYPQGNHHRHYHYTSYFSINTIISHRREITPRLGIPPAATTASFARGDEEVLGLNPSLIWMKSGSLGNGCDGCWSISIIFCWLIFMGWGLALVWFSSVLFG